MSEKQEFVLLGNIADILMGQSPDAARCNSDERGLPFLQGCAEFGKQTPHAVMYCSPPLRVSKSDSILISVRAPVGKMNWGEQSYCIGRGLSAIKAMSELSDTKFLGYSIDQNVAFLHRRSQGSTFLAISANDLRIFPIPAIPYKKQKKISWILQTIDQAIEKTEALIEKYQQIKAGLMHDLFTRGITADGKLRPPREQAPELYQETPIGWLPKEWDHDFLEKLLAPIPSSLRSGPFGSALLKSELVEEGIPFLGIDNIYVEKFVGKYRRFVSEKKFNELIKYAVRPKDVVITIMGTVGRCSLIPDKIGKALSSKHLWTMTIDQSVAIPELICWQLNYASWVQAWFRRETQGGIMDAIQSKTLKNLRLPVPPMAEQEKILERYEALSSKIQMESDNLDKLKKEKSGLMNDLLTGKVSVTIDEPEAAHA